MPTRIVLDSTDAKKKIEPSRNVNARGLFMLNDQNDSPLKKRSAVFKTNRHLFEPENKRQSEASRVVNFRSSIFREGSRDKPSPLLPDSVSSTDIRGSPRLIGYLYQLLASTVLLITVVKFYENSQNDEVSIFSIDLETVFKGDDRIYETIHGRIYYWKLMGSALVGSVGAGCSLLIVLVHVDTVFFPRLWYKMFRDGSRYEQNLLRLMLLFWIVSLHVCTSSLSVGQVQGNVYFTVWIAFVASAINVGVWRVSAGFPSIAEKISLHQRATTYNWVWSFFFVVTFAGSATDTFINRSELTFSHKGEVVELTLKDWYYVLGFVWFFVFVCVMALLFNQFLEKSSEIRIFGGSRVILGWRQTEGIIIFFMLAVFFWIIYTYTGVDAIMNGLPNAYYSVWGCFFNTVNLLGTWMRENKSIEYIVANDKKKSKRNRYYDA